MMLFSESWVELICEKNWQLTFELTTGYSVMGREAGLDDFYGPSIHKGIKEKVRKVG